ncbi:tyrosine-type recombinase/integrase [Metabacillus dongyingensis]|uniref:tyrosine-type recombinase/integrase n=1 Tax=Metabacillus dongyingensis TaxID=2874282 RepID=UPI003B8C0091
MLCQKGLSCINEFLILCTFSVFMNKPASLVEQKKSCRSSKSYCTKAPISLETNLKKKLHPHILRHTHTSMLTESGGDLRSIMERLGHTGAKTTLSVYTHVTEKMKIDAAEKLSEAFGDLVNH